MTLIKCLNLRALAACVLYGAGALVATAVDPVLIWSDEFEGSGLPDSSKWLYDVGGSGWGNDEQQYYTEARLENARVEEGILIIEARKEPWPAGRNPENEYTSARLVSKGRGDWLYGRIEVMAKIPAGRGTWPAIWMLSTGREYGIWPRSGEIDIMEHVGFDMGMVHGSLHSFDHNWTSEVQTTGETFVEGVDTAFHVYAIEWSPSSIRFFVDSTEYYSFTNPGTGWREWPFDQPFHLILNLAVGGTWGGQQGIDPDIWPARLEVDYVRVYDMGDTVPLDTDNDLDPNATDPDDDGDGLTDVEEHELGTNLLKADTDGDGYTDLEEIVAGTYPLLSGSYPGSDESILMVNNDFAYGDEPWIIHTNLRSARTPESYVGQASSWAGTYEVFDYVSIDISGEVVFHSYAEGEDPYAEHLLYQEWNRKLWNLMPGDVIRFRGTARASAIVGDMVTQAYIRMLDSAYAPLETAILDIGAEAVPFELDMTIGETDFLLLQAGFVIEGAQSDSATITFSDLEATLNEEQMWGFWSSVEDIVDTGGWMGPLYVGNQPWVWSFTLETWIYLPLEHITETGAWVYITNEL